MSKKCITGGRWRVAWRWSGCRCSVCSGGIDVGSNWGLQQGLNLGHLCSRLLQLLTLIISEGQQLHDSFDSAKVPIVGCRYGGGSVAIIVATLLSSSLSLTSIPITFFFSTHSSPYVRRFPPFGVALVAGAVTVVVVSVSAIITAVVVPIVVVAIVASVGS